MKLVIPEPETEALELALRDVERALSSEISEVEVTRAVRSRIGTKGDRRLGEVLANVELVTFDRRARTRAGELDPRTLRSLDSIHIATALGLEYPDIVFVGYDPGVQAAAAAAGLVTASPSHASPGNASPGNASPNSASPGRAR